MSFRDKKVCFIEGHPTYNLFFDVYYGDCGGSFDGGGGRSS
jgi:hypothetical protein